MMKGQYHDRLFLSWLGRSLAVCAVVLALMVVSGTAQADVGMPPPSSVISNAPTGSNVPFVVGKDGNVLRVPQDSYDRIINKSSKAQFESASRASGGTSELTTARKTINASFRDNHGASARGTVRTTTQLPPTSRMAQGLGALIVADLATSHLGNLKANGAADQFVRGMENGDWVMVAGAVGKIFDWTGIGSRLNAALNNDAVPTSSLQQQSEQQARQLFDQYQASKQPIDPAAFEQYKILKLYYWTPLTSNNPHTLAIDILPGTVADTSFSGQASTVSYQVAIGDRTYVVPNIDKPGDPTWFSGSIAPASAADIIRYNKGAAPTIDQVLPGEAAIIDLLTRLLNDTNRNNTALINAIWGSGVANGGNTTTTVDNSTTNNNTFLTSPYTPAGSNTPQQTQFKVNKDGSVTATTVPRPDLAPNSSQAPTRAEIPTAPVPGNTTPTNPTNPGETKPTEPASASQPNICAQNPDSAMCAELGNADYEDPVIPEQQKRLDFNPASIFNTDGQCPMPKRISLIGTEHEFSYQPMCDFARGARPMLIALGMVLAMGMAYSAAKEL